MFSLTESMGTDISSHTVTDTINIGKTHWAKLLQFTRFSRVLDKFSMNITISL